MLLDPDAAAETFLVAMEEVERIFGPFPAIVPGPGVEIDEPRALDFDSEGPHLLRPVAEDFRRHALKRVRGIALFLEALDLGVGGADSLDRFPRVFADLRQQPTGLFEREDLGLSGHRVNIAPVRMR